MGTRRKEGRKEEKKKRKKGGEGAGEQRMKETRIEGEKDK